MNEMILVTYATRSGYTTGVAECIGKVLRERGAQVDVRPVGDFLGPRAADLSRYSMIVAGSAIQGQKWLPEAMQFLRAHRGALSHVRFAAFLVCITLTMKDAGQYHEGVTAWMAPVRAIAQPVREGYFAGGLDLRKTGFSLNTLLMRIPVLMGLWQPGDHRDWDAIRAWANAL
jgi:menaquinone-dependent protoporphyrinogen oxidase